MKLYDDIIDQESRLFARIGTGLKELGISMDPNVWKDDGKGGIVLKSDMQCELGGGNFPAVGSQLVTLDQALVDRDGLYLIGPDLCEIKKDQPYARIAWILLDEHSPQKGEHLAEGRLYDLIRSIEYVRYRVNPHGYMQRISAAAHREPVRIGKRAVAEGLDFAKVGALYIRAYQSNPLVKAVKMFFVTDPNADYHQLAELAQKAERITQALDHVLKDFNMNCSACNLKDVCDEVEELKKLHFRESGGSRPEPI